MYVLPKVILNIYFACFSLLIFSIQVCFLCLLCVLMLQVALRRQQEVPFLVANKTLKSSIRVFYIFFCMKCPQISFFNQNPQVMDNDVFAQNNIFWWTFIYIVLSSSCDSTEHFTFSHSRTHSYTIIYTPGVTCSARAATVHTLTTSHSGVICGSVSHNNGVQTTYMESKSRPFEGNKTLEKSFYLPVPLFIIQKWNFYRGARG